MQSNAKPKLLITSSILDSFAWYKRCPPSWRQKAYKSLVASIRREGYKPHQTAQRGIDFENAIYRQKEGGSVHFQKVRDACTGGRYQTVLKKEIEVNGRKVLLYGKVDVEFPLSIVDIKTTETYRGDEKYLQGWQHRLYCFMSGKSYFKYIVGLMVAYPGNEMLGSYTVDYKVEDHDELALDIQNGIWTFYEWLEQECLFHDYETIFSNPRRKR